MGKKKIQPTDAMVDAVESARELMALDARTIMRAALNHPDAPGLFADETTADNRPWEPLNDRPVHVGDEVRQEVNGVTTIAVVGLVDGEGDPWTTEHRLIGVLDEGTWYVRRATQPLPPERDGVVLVPADGHKAITTSDGQEFSRLTFTTKQSIWYGPNLAAQLVDWVIQTTSLGRLTPGTWKVADQ